MLIAFLVAFEQAEAAEVKEEADVCSVNDNDCIQKVARNVASLAKYLPDFTVYKVSSPPFGRLFP